MPDAGPREEGLAEKLNHAGFEFAKSVVRSGKVVRYEGDDSSEHQLSSEKENEFIRLRVFPNTRSGI